MSDDKAPTVFLKDGTPVKVRMVGMECEGDVSGEGHFAYQQSSKYEEEPTVYFEETEVDDEIRYVTIGELWECKDCDIEGSHGVFGRMLHELRRHTL